MKSKRLLLLLLIALFAPWAANAQTTVEIGDGTATTNTNPIGTYYNYSITEQLYTAEEIGMAGTISSISFYYMGIAAKDLPITVYMQNVDAADLSTGISLADADEVFSGTLPVTTAAGWVTIDLDAPFAYDGTSNLLIGIIKDYLYYFSGQSWQGTSVSNMARYSQSDYDAYTTSAVPAYAASVRPNIQIVINPSGAPVCEKPESMEASDVTTNSATLTWTGGSGTYNVEYKGGDAADWTAYLSNTTATTANLTGLTPGTNYQYRVQSVCSDGVSGWKSVSFSTMFGIPLVEGFGTTIPSGWSIYSGLVEDVLAGGDLTTASYGWSFGSNNGVFDDHARVNIYGTGCNYWLVLPTLAMEDNVQLMFDVAYTAFSGSGAPALTGEDDKFVVLINNGRTWEVVRQWDNAGSEYVLNDLNTTPITVAIDLSNYAEAGQPITVAFYGESTVSNADNNLHIDNVSIDYIPACAKPTGLAVNYEGGTEATISWTSDATAWNMRVNGTEINGTITNPYTLTGLELATTYEVEVQANCGDATSDWVGPVSFTTDNCMPEDQCALTFVVTDSYGDGWNGASIDIYDYTGEELGNLLASVSNTSDAEAGVAQTYTVNICDGQLIAIIWTSGSYDGECSYTVTDINGEVLVEGSGAGFDGFAYIMDCTETDCRKPTDFVATEIGPRSVKLSWTENGPATEWVIAYLSENDEEITEITVNTNPYTLTGLDPETMYAAQVTPVCEVDKPSDVIYWTTDVACPRPSNLSVTPYPFSADVAWEGFADVYDLEWALMPAPESKDALWLQYDNNTYYGGIGNTPASTWTWGVMYPASMLEGNGMLTKVSIYENSTYNTEDITINVYTGGDTAPGTLVYTETVTPVAGDAFHEIVFAEPVMIDITQNLWITLTEYGTYVMSYCDNGDNANNDWVNNGGTWAHIGDLAASLAGDTWMIRGYVEPAYDPEELDWNPVSGVTSPYTIEDLQPETTYVVRVKAICGGEDGESGWFTVSFVTPSACDMPIDLVAEDITYNSAKLSWTGYQESYNVRYRGLAHMDEVVSSENFDEGMADWTTIDADGDGYIWVSSMTPEDYHNAGVDLTGNGHNESAHFVLSGSYSNASGEALTPDNYLVSPQITLGGVVEFWACAQDANWSAEHFGVAVSTTNNTDASAFTTIAEWTIENGNTWTKYVVDLSNYSGQGYVAIRHFNCTDQFILNVDDIAFGTLVPSTDWVDLTVTEPTVTLTGLTANTEYEWQVQGVNASCGTLDWTEIQNFTTTEQTTATQTLALAAGASWVSFNVETTLNDLKAALLEATEGVQAITIQEQLTNTRYNPNNHRWTGQLTALDMSKMYKISVDAACEITLEGMPVDPTALPINIASGSNWIAYPLRESMSVANAFAGFAVNGDKVQEQINNASYNGTRWSGQLRNLVPGAGYIYQSDVEESRTLVFPSVSGKSAQPEGNALQAGVSLVKQWKARTEEVEIAPVKSVDKKALLYSKLTNKK